MYTYEFTSIPTLESTNSSYLESHKNKYLGNISMKLLNNIVAKCLGFFVGKDMTPSILAAYKNTDEFYSVQISNRLTQVDFKDFLEYIKKIM